MAPRPFRFGLLNETLAPADRWRSLVRRAEELGYATLLIRDHFVPDVFGDQYAPLAALMAAAAITTRLRVGSMVLGNDYRHPVMLAKEAATIDVLSDGRFELGLGAGWLRAEYEQAGIAFEPAGARIERLEEAIRIIRGLWSDAPLSFSGKHYQISELRGAPIPVQQPCPPLLIGGGKERMLRLAGRHADSVGLLTTSVATGALVDDVAERTPAAVRQKLAWIREGAGARFSRLELSLIPTLAITARRRQRTDDLIRSRGWAGVTAEDVWQMPSVVVGSTDQVVDDLLRQREEYGFSYYIIGDEHIESFAPVVARLASR